MPSNFESKPPCSSVDCPKASFSKGLCQKHYNEQWYRARKEMTAKPCATSTCANSAYGSRMFCATCRTVSKGLISKAAAARQEFLDNRPSCSVAGCTLTIVAKTSRSGRPRMLLCPSHYDNFCRKSLSVDRFVEILSAELCESCGLGGPLVMDHYHSCDRHTARDAMCDSCVRGMICSGCNTALGLLGEDPGRIRALAAYVER